ncbi:hypothetical protein CsSME_00053675 [Camellia sinensis var. sinensis]
MLQNFTGGSAVGFKLDSLLKLTDTRASNSRMTLMHYLCKYCSGYLCHPHGSLGPSWHASVLAVAPENLMSTKPLGPIGKGRGNGQCRLIGGQCT